MEFPSAIFNAAANRFSDNGLETIQCVKCAKGRAQILLAEKDELRRLVEHIDLTSLNADDSHEKIEALVARAQKPLGESSNARCAAVCVYPSFVNVVKQGLPGDSDIKIASVAGGFPSGQYRIESRVLEIMLAIADGANEIDIVINRGAAREQNWKLVYDEIVKMKAASGRACLKTILATGELATPKDIYLASWAAMLAGSDFIKTSTGKESVNATMESTVVMCRAIRDFEDETGKIVGLKVAGGLKTVTDAMNYRALVENYLGERWLHSNLFRIGASSLLDDIVQKL